MEMSSAEASLLSYSWPLTQFSYQWVLFALTASAPSAQLCICVGDLMRMGLPEYFLLCSHSLWLVHFWYWQRCPQHQNCQVLKAAMNMFKLIAFLTFSLIGECSGVAFLPIFMINKLSITSHLQIHLHFLIIWKIIWKLMYWSDYLFKKKKSGFSDSSFINVSDFWCLWQ